jgi:hypothetical protein
MDLGTQKIQVALANGANIQVEATMLTGEEDVAFENLSFQGISDAIEGISESILLALRKAKPSKASVELGLDIGLDAGKLTALLVKLDAKANLKIKLEWEQQSKINSI